MSSQNLDARRIQKTGAPTKHWIALNTAQFKEMILMMRPMLNIMAPRRRVAGSKLIVGIEWDHQ